MIDLHLLRENPDMLKQAILKKDPDFNIDRLIKLDESLRTINIELEELRAQKNDLAKQARGGITDELREQSVSVGKKIKQLESDANEQQEAFTALYLRCPNIVFDDVPVGNKEQNRVVKEFGTKPTFSFPVKNHVELGKDLGWLDFEHGADVAGAGFVVYRGEAVSLMYALTMFMLCNNKKHGYELALPPVLVNETSLQTSGNFPKFAQEVYAMPEDELYLSPTAEVGLTNLYRNHIFAGQDLPVRMTAWTSCFRREAGGYGSSERGLIRIHQFEKVELYALTKPENSAQEQERMLACAQDILQQFGLHYRVSLLATQDCSFQSAKTYDIEVWLPGQNMYYEVSSASNCTDFQARRGGIRYKETPESKTQLVHTLNCSSLALPRLMVALMEVYQQEDGSIALPEVLTKSPFFL